MEPGLCGKVSAIFVGISVLFGFLAAVFATVAGAAMAFAAVSATCGIVAAVFSYLACSN